MTAIKILKRLLLVFTIILPLYGLWALTALFVILMEYILTGDVGIFIYKYSERFFNTINKLSK